MWLGLVGILACNTPSNEEPAATPAPAAPGGVAASVDLAAGEAFGAVFWREGRAWRLGGEGAGLLGPGGAGEARVGQDQGPCGVSLEGAPERAVLAVPAGKTPTAPPEAPANLAGVVERAAWRLDEALPPRDRFTPAVDTPDPALQRGVRVASVVKTRRQGAPPVLLASGTRDCTTAVALLDHDAGKLLAWDRLDQACEPLSLLPVADYDGDGARELAAYNDARVVLYRLVEEPGRVGLTRILDRTCR